MSKHDFINFEIVTPEKVVLREQVIGVTVPTESGEITILPGHIPLISVLKPGVIELHKPDGQDKEILAVSGGFIEVLEGKVVILANTAEIAKELDEERIKEARRRAEELKKQTVNKDEVLFAEAAAMLEKELARSKAIRRLKHRIK